MHPLALLRRKLKSRSMADIHEALAEIRPADAAALLDGTHVDAEGALVLGRGLESGAEALPYRTLVALRLLPPDAALRQEIRHLRLHFRTPEPAPLDLASLGPLPALETLALINAAGVSVLPALPTLHTLDLRDATGLDLAALLAARPLRGLVLARQTLSAAMLAPQTTLHALTLRDCPEITEIPALPLLERLEVRGCADLATPLSLAGLSALTHLRADMDVQAPPTPAPLVVLHLEDTGRLGGDADLPALEVLRAHDVEEEAGLARSPALREVHLDHWHGADLVPLGGAEGLEALHLHHAEALEALEGPGGWAGLRALTVRQAPVTALAALAGAAALVELDLRGCVRLATVDGLEACAALRIVDLGGCVNIQHVHALRDLAGLERVVLQMVRNPTMVVYEGEALEALRERLAESHRRRVAMEQGDPMAVRVRGLLMHGDLHHQRQALEVMRALGEDFAEEVLGESVLTEAGELVVPFGEPSEALLLATVAAGRAPEPLTRLVLRGERFGRLDGLGALSGVETLELRACGQLTSLAGLETLPRLRHLEIHGCARLRDISALRWARSLETLRITGRRVQGGLLLAPLIGTAALRILAHVPHLEVLDLRGCGPLELPVISGLSRLRELRATGLVPPDSLSRLAGLGHLEILTLEGCAGLEDLHALRGLSRLQTLVLAGGLAARDLSALQGLRALEVLHIGGPGLRDADALCALTGLRDLTLEGCSGLSSVKFLQALPRLQRLYLEGPDITTLNDLRGLSALETLTVQNLPRLHSLDGVEGCPALRHLAIETGCPELRLAEALLEAPALETLRLLEGSQFQLSPTASERQGRDGGVRLGSWLRRLRAWLRHKQQVTREAMRAAVQGGEAAAITQELADLRALADLRLTAALLAADGPTMPPAVRAAVQDIDAQLRRDG